MKRLKFLSVLTFPVFFAFSLVACAADLSYDVVIYGGCSGAVTAAVQTVKMGKTPVIVCPDRHLGGLSSAGLGATDSGNRTVIGGLSREFYHRLWLHYEDPTAWNWMKAPNLDIPGQGGRGFDSDTKSVWVFEPHVAEGIFEDFVREFKIPVFRNQYLDRSTKTSGVIKNGNTIVAIETTEGMQNDPSNPESGKKRSQFRGKIFIDATYEGDLLAQAGVSYTQGRESNAQYNETLNGIQTAQGRHHQFVPHVDPYVIPGKPESGLLPMINKDPGGEDGTADSKIQAYCYRLCMTTVEENKVPFEKPSNYDPLNYELYLRSIEAGQRFLMIISPMPNQKTDTNNGGPFSHDFIAGNYDYLDASDVERVKICKAHEDWQQGLMWTLQNNPRVPENVQASYKRWGLAKDEFGDTRHFGHKIYVREGRRMVSDFVQTELHCRRLAETPRPIGYGSYQMDSHHTQRYLTVDENGKAIVLNEGDVEVSPGGPYPIDYGTLVPKKDECSNLFVSVCVSCSHIAYGSIRMEPVFMILGQSAATAACMAIDNNCPVQEVNYDKLAEQLRKDGQVLEYANQRRPGYLPQKKAQLKGIVVDSSEAKITGEWQHGTVVPPWVEADYIHDMNEKKGEKFVEFPVRIEKAGKYEVRIAYSPLDNRATNIPITVSCAECDKTVLVNQRENPKYDGLFQPIGEFSFNEGQTTIIISNKNTNGFVMVDAIQLIEK